MPEVRESPRFLPARTSVVNLVSFPFLTLEARLFARLWLECLKDGVLGSVFGRYLSSCMKQCFPLYL